MRSSAEKMLTIVVPAYNVEKYVGQCLESLVRQTCDRFKVIVVDDGATDAGTSRICKDYAARHPALISYVRQENKGLGAARNTGLSMVNTPYVTFLDSDDWLDLRYVEYVIDALEKYDDDAIDIVFTLPTIYDSITSQMWEWNDTELFNHIFTPDSPVIDMGIDERPFDLEPSICRRVLRTDFLRQYDFRFPEGTRWEDVFPHFYLLTHAKRCLGVKEVGFFYRINVPTSITATGSRGRLEIAPVFAKTLNYLMEGGYSTGIVNRGLKMCVNFSLWSISMSQQTVRRELIDKLHELFASLPKDRIKTLLKTKGMLNREQQLFVRVIRSKRFCHLLDDYQTIAAARLMMNKLKAVVRKFRR